MLPDGVYHLSYRPACHEDAVLFQAAGFVRETRFFPFHPAAVAYQEIHIPRCGLPCFAGFPAGFTG